MVELEKISGSGNIYEISVYRYRVATGYIYVTTYNYNISTVLVLDEDYLPLQDY